MISLLGNCGFDDCCLPLKGKSEFGMDTLTRKVMGARSLAEAYIATLAQGQAYQGYFLQTWDSDDNPQIATITLNYKGLLTGGTPVPKNETQISAAAGSASISFATENGGIGRAYRIIPLYSVVTAVDNLGHPVESTVVGTRSVYTTGAQVNFTYNAVQSVYSYITNGKPAAPRYSVVNSTFVPIVIEARGLTADGSIFGKEQAIFGAFNIQVIERVIGFNVIEVIGSPFCECQDIVRKELGVIDEP